MTEMTPEHRARVRRRYRNTPVPAAETAEGKARLQEYWNALGEFIDGFARAERDMFLALRWHTKTQDKIARAVFSGVRVDATADFLRRLATVGAIGAPEWEQLEPITAQLKAISDARNLLLHYGAEQIAEGAGNASNRAIALNEEAAKSIPISPDILRDMIHDIRKIRIHLRVRHVGMPPLRAVHSSIDEALNAPWRYKPPAPTQARPKERAKRQKRPGGRQ